VEEDGLRWPRVRVMALNSDSPDIGDGRVVITAFDLLYWDGVDYHERPFGERRRKLEEVSPTLERSGIEITPQMEIKSEEDLVKAWESPEFGQAPISEGIVLKDLQWVYTARETDGMAKIKHKLEIKARVVGKVQTGNGLWVYSCELKGGVPIGETLATPIEASEGDVITVEVEEIIWDPSIEKISWLGAKVLDVDKERTEGYAVGQVVDLARRARVLFESPSEVSKDREEDAVLNWENEWYNAIPISGKSLRYVIHAHFRGLDEEETTKSLEELLHTDNSVHFDLRLETDRDGGFFWGWTLYAGRAEENVPTLKIAKLAEGEVLAGAPKQFGPLSWLDVGSKGPLVVGPGGVGATSKSWAKFFRVDWGHYRVGMARQHAVELFFEGNILKGRYMLQYALLNGRRQWLFSRPQGQRPYAETHSLEQVVEEIKSKGQKYLFWPKEGEEGLQMLVVKSIYRICKSEEEKRYTLGVAYPANEIDAHGDFTTPEELEEAAWKFMQRVQRGFSGVGLFHQPGTEYSGGVVESYIYRGPRWEVNGQVVEPGDWLLGVRWTEKAWELIKSGKVTGYSIQGYAYRR
jgi:hypothetical protein